MTDLHSQLPARRGNCEVHAEECQCGAKLRPRTEPELPYSQVECDLCGATDEPCDQVCRDQRAGREPALPDEPAPAGWCYDLDRPCDDPFGGSLCSCRLQRCGHMRDSGFISPPVGNKVAALEECCPGPGGCKYPERCPGCAGAECEAHCPHRQSPLKECPECGGVDGPCATLQMCNRRLRAERDEWRDRWRTAGKRVVELRAERDALRAVFDAAAEWCREWGGPREDLDDESNALIDAVTNYQSQEQSVDD